VLAHLPWRLLDRRGNLGPGHQSLGRGEAEGTADCQTAAEHGVQVNFGNGRERGTPLHRAVAAGRRDSVELLLDKGANITSRDRYGRTPLHWAVSSKNLKMVALLLARRAQVNARDVQGKTPMYDTGGALVLSGA
jgi:ankyrin repeat protein